MSDITRDFDSGSEEILGIIHDEHFDPEDESYRPAMIRGRVLIFEDRTFYSLTAEEGGDSCGVDLDRQGWQELRALCDAMIARIDKDATESKS